MYIKRGLKLLIFLLGHFIEPLLCKPIWQCMFHLVGVKAIYKDIRHLIFVTLGCCVMCLSKATLHSKYTVYQELNPWLLTLLMARSSDWARKACHCCCLHRSHFWEARTLCFYRHSCSESAAVGETRVPIPFLFYFDSSPRHFAYCGTCVDVDVL